MNAWSNLPWQIGAEGWSTPQHDHRMIVPVVGEDPYPEKRNRS